jgi:cation transporter-like permease
MPKRILLSVLFGLMGYVVAAVAGHVLLSALTTNGHDGAVEAAVMAAFVFGPAGAVLGLVYGWVRGGRAART